MWLKESCGKMNMIYQTKFTTREQLKLEKVYITVTENEWKARSNNHKITEKW